MTIIPSRTTCVLSALVAALVWTTASTNVSGQDGQGIHFTRNGFRAPVYGAWQTSDANGNAVASCDALTAPQVDALRIGRQVSRAMLESSPQVVVATEGGATFDVRYPDAAGTGFNDSANGETRRRVVEAALLSWSKVIKAEQPIRVEASMREIDDGDNNPNTMILAFAGPTEYWLIENKVVPSSLAWQLIGGRFENARDTDITISVNSRANWEYSLEVQPPRENTHSLFYTLLHEVGHGLGISNSFDLTTGRLLNDPLAFVTDAFVNRGSDRRNPILDHPAEERVRDLKSRDLFHNGENTGAASRQVEDRPLPMPKLYAPDPVQPGSSVSHLDQDTYRDIRRGGLLMMPLIVYQVNDTDKIHPLTQAWMKDMGYTLVPPANTTPTSVGFTRPQ